MAAPSSDERKRRVLAGLLAVIGLVLWAQFLVIPQSRSAARLETELKKLREQIGRTEADLKRMPSLEKMRDSMGTRNPAHAVVAPEEQLPDLLEKVAQVARNAHVRVISLRPKEELAGLRPGPSGCLEISLELSATAGYHPVGFFLDELERSDSLVDVRDLKIVPGTGDDLLNHQVKMTLQAFLAPAAVPALPPPDRAAYQPRGKRDPFVPLVAPDGRRITPPGFEEEPGHGEIGDVALQGIVFDPAGDSYAILGGRVLHEQQEWEGIKLLKIEPDRVTILKDGQTHLLTVRQPEKEKPTE